MSTPNHRTWGEGDGPGTPARRPGSTASAWSRSSGFKSEVPRSLSIPAFPRSGEAYEIAYRHGETLYRITVENPKGVCRGVASVTLDGTPLAADALIPLADNARDHEVRVVLGWNHPTS